jgi:hypothetical protein
MMKIGSLTHTGQRLETVSIAEVLATAEAFCRWEAGAPTSRGATRGDLGGPDTRRSCTLGARFRLETTDSRQEVA